MNHTKIYNQLIERSKTRIPPEGYIEHHHIVPRCLGGSDDQSNIAILTPEEHFVAHVLLVKMYPNQSPLWYAIHRMATLHRKGLKAKHNKMYGWLRRGWIKNMSGSNHPMYGTKWITDGKSNKFIKNSESIPRGWYFGKTVKKNVLIYITDGNITKKHDKNESIPVGWSRGTSSRGYKTGSRFYHLGNKRILIKKGEIPPIGWCRGTGVKNNKDTVWITNGIKNKMIPKNDSVPEGWYRGRN